MNKNNIGGSGLWGGGGCMVDPSSPQTTTLTVLNYLYLDLYFSCNESCYGSCVVHFHSYTNLCIFHRLVHKYCTDVKEAQTSPVQ